MQQTCHKAHLWDWGSMVGWWRELHWPHWTFLHLTNVPGWWARSRRQGYDPAVIPDPNPVPQAVWSSLRLLSSPQRCATNNSGRAPSWSIGNAVTLPWVRVPMPHGSTAAELNLCRTWGDPLAFPFQHKLRLRCTYIALSTSLHNSLLFHLSDTVSDTNPAGKWRLIIPGT